MNKNLQHTSIASSYLLTSDKRLQKNGLIQFDQSGRILSVETEVADLDSRPNTAYYNGILIPGMVNAHCHLELSFFQGVIPQHTGLVGFIKHVIGERGKYTVEQQIEAARLHSEFMWREGIQAVGDISNQTESFAAKVESKIRYYTFAEYFGMPPEQKAEQFLHDQTLNVQAGMEKGLKINPTPHSTYLVSDRLLRLGANYPRLSIHFMETPSEMGLYRKEGGMYQYIIESGMQPDFLQYGSHPRRLVESLPGDIPLILIHNTQIDREGVEMITDHFSDVTFVLCPRSNYYIEAAYPPAEMLQQMGVRIALGTDSLSSNTSLSMVEEIKWVSKHNPSIPLEEILHWSTMGGAIGLGMESEIGSFEVGKRSGAVLLTDVDLQNMKLTDATRAERIL